MSDTFWRDLERDELWKQFWDSERVKRSHAYWIEEMKKAEDLRTLGLAQGYIRCFEELKNMPERMAKKSRREDD